MLPKYQLYLHFLYKYRHMSTTE